MNESYPLPRGWTWQPLGQHAEVSGGFGFPKDYQGKTDLRYPFVKVSDMNVAEGDVYVTAAVNSIDDAMAQVLKARIFPTNTVIFPKIGGAIATNKKRLLGCPATFDNNVMGVVAGPSLDYKWCLYFLRSIDLMELAHVGPVPSIRQSAVEDRLLPLPYPDDPARSLETQRRIVARIEALFAELRECRKLHQAVVEDTDRLMDAVLAEVFGNVDGQNWHPQTLGELVDNYDHVRVPVRKADREKMQGEYPYYGATGVIDFVDSFLFDGEYLLISEDGANLIARKYPIAFIATGRFWVNNHAHVVRAKPTTSNQYLAYVIAATDISHLVTGAAQPKLNQTKMNQIPIWLPKEKTTQDKIVAYLDETRAQLLEMQKSQAEDGGLLSEMEQAILAQAFRGEL